MNQLWEFLKHSGIPLTKDGCFLAYKGVRGDYFDAHSRRFQNSPGKILEIPRNQVSDDPAHACHEGFHVGDLSYARGFSERVMVVKVDPENVVCVPKDESQRKMRVSKYKVLGHYGGQLPDAFFDEDEEVPPPVLEDGEVTEIEVPEEIIEKPTVRTRSDVKEVPNVEIHGKRTGVDKKMPKSFNKIHAMDSDALMEQPLDKLRQYATHGLFIIGASKIGGGKMMLVRRILDTRGD